MENNKELILSNLNKTWLFDLDGTICVHNGYKIFGKDKIIDKAKQFIDNINEEDMIIFITSRKKIYKEETEKFLKDNNIRYNYIIYEAPFGERIVINDKKPSGLKTAYALNIERDNFEKIEIKIDDQL